MSLDDRSTLTLFNFGVQVRREAVFEKLSVIAFKSINKGLIFINEELVQECIDEIQMKETVKGSAFLLLEVCGVEYRFPI